MTKFDLRTGILFFCPKEATKFPNMSIPPSILRLHGNTYLVGNSRATIALLYNSLVMALNAIGKIAPD